MSPLMIILLMLILIIGSGRPIAVEKSAFSFPGANYQNYQNFSSPDGVNFFNFSVGKNERDPATTMQNRLRKNLQHLLSTMVEKIIQRGRTRESKFKIFGKTVESNKIPIGEILGHGENFERGANSSRSDVGYNYENFGGRGGGSDARFRLSKDLVQVSEALMPTVRRFGRLRDARGYREESGKPRINRGNSSETVLGSRVKRQNPKNEEHSGVAWMKKDFADDAANWKMHAFVVRDEEIPPCCSPAKNSSNRRYFMCSGAVLTLKHAITSAACIHYADIYKSNVIADLAVLVGAAEPRAYVIKINRYDMHPDYDFDVDSKNHATNNLAVLFLACSIVAQDVVVPHLPKGVNDDVAHMCCREGCDLITIMESPDNLHTARIVPAKHLPAPRHDDEDAASYQELSNSALEAIEAINKPIFFNQSRRSRSPAKFAAAPTFFGNASRRYSRPPSSAKSAKSSNAKKRKKTKSSGLKNRQRGGKRKKKVKLADLVNRRSGRAHIPILRALEEQGVNVEEELAAIDWQKVESSVGKKFSSNNREKLETFAKNVVDETMRRLENVLDDEDDSASTGNGNTVFEKLMPNKSRNKTIENFVHVFTKVVSSIIPPNEGPSPLAISEDASVEEKDLRDPPTSNQQCPPLGTPVFADGTLVGLLAYTCDDVQSWVEWKYVNVARNLNWIRKEMTMEQESMGICAGSEKPVTARRKLPEDGRSVRKLPRGTEAEIRDGKVDWKRRDTDVHRSVTAGNLDRARNPPVAAYPRIPKDPWFAKNSPLAPPAHREDERQRIFADSRNEPQSTARHAPVYNVNTCYVKPDGGTDCQTRVDLNAR